MDLPDSFMDIHICGLCRQVFNDVELFMCHKKRCPANARLLANIQEQKRKKGTEGDPELLSQHEPLYNSQPQNYPETSVKYSNCHAGPFSDALSMGDGLYRKPQYSSFGHTSLDRSKAEVPESVIVGEGSITDPQNMAQGDTAASYSLGNYESSCVSLKFSFEAGLSESDTEFEDTTSKGEEQLDAVPATQPLNSVVEGECMPPSSGTSMSDAVVNTSQSESQTVNEEIVVSGTDELTVLQPQQKQQQQIASTQLTMLLDHSNLVSSLLTSVPSTRDGSAHHRYLRPHHIVLPGHPLQHVEQSSLLQAVNETIAEADMRSRQIVLDTGQDDSLRTDKQISSGVVQSKDLLNYCFDHGLDRFVTEPANATLVQRDQQETAQDGGADTNCHESLVNPVSSGANMSLTEHSDSSLYRGEAKEGQDCGTVYMDTEVEEHLDQDIIELTEDGVFEDGYRVVEERPTLPSGVVGELTSSMGSCGQRRRRHTVPDTTLMSPSPPLSPKHLVAPNAQQLQELHEHWQQRISELAEPTFSKTVKSNAANPQDLAGGISDLQGGWQSNQSFGHRFFPPSCSSTSFPPTSSIPPPLVHPAEPLSQAQIAVLDSAQALLSAAGVQASAGTQRSGRVGGGRLSLKGDKTSRMKLGRSGGTKAQRQVLTLLQAPEEWKEVNGGLSLAVLPVAPIKTYKERNIQSPKDTENNELLKKNPEHQELTSLVVKRKLFKCEECAYETTYYKDLCRHMHTHTGERPFECPHCQKTFNRSDKLKVHVRWHTGDKPFKCKLCDYASIDSGSLKKHTRTHTDERPFQCQICPYASRNSSQLIVHLRTHTGDTPFGCSLCGAKFKIKSDLNRHMRKHTGEKPFQCHICAYKCSVKGNLNTHYRLHHCPDKQLKCETCSFSSASPKLLREHVKQHTEADEAVTCPKCHYICSTTSSLKNHLRTHSDEKPYKCDYCDYSTRQRGNLKSHAQKRHPEKIRSSRRHGRPRGSSKHSHRREAMAVSHSAVRQESREFRRHVTSTSRLVRSSSKVLYQCHLCDASFFKDHSLRSHLRQHGIEPTAHSLISSLTGVRPLESLYKVQDGMYVQVIKPRPVLKQRTKGPRRLAPKPSMLPTATISPMLESDRSATACGQHLDEGRLTSAREVDQTTDGALLQPLDDKSERQGPAAGSAPDELQLVLSGDPAQGPEDLVQVVEVPIGIDSVRYSDGTVIENVLSSGPSDQKLTILTHDSSFKGFCAEGKRQQQVYLDGVIVSDGEPASGSDENEEVFNRGDVCPADYGTVVQHSKPMEARESQPLIVMMDSEDNVSSAAPGLDLPKYLSQHLIARFDGQHFVANIDGQQISFVQQLDPVEGVKLVQVPCSCSSTSSSMSASCTSTLTSRTVTGSSSSSSSSAQPVTTITSASSSLRRSSRLSKGRRSTASARTRTRHAKTTCSLTLPQPQPQHQQQQQQQHLHVFNPSSNFVMSDSSQASGLVSSISDHNSGRVMQIQLPMSSEGKMQTISLVQQPTIQYQMSSPAESQQFILTSPQQQQQQTQHMQLLPGELPISIQVIQDALFQQQQQYQPPPPTVAHVPINIFTTPISLHHQHQLPSQPPTPPTQIQIFLPPALHPSPPPPPPSHPLVQPGQRIVLQLPDPFAASSPSPSPQLLPPPPHTQSPPVHHQPPALLLAQEGQVQMTTQSGQLLTVPQSVWQSISSQLQSGAMVRLLTSDEDGDLSDIAIQEIVVQLDPQLVTHTAQFSKDGQFPIAF